MAKMKLEPGAIDSLLNIDAVGKYLIKDAKLTKVLRIGSYDVPVYEHPEIMSLGVWGFAQLSPEYRIFVASSVPIHQRRRTVLHESIEIINDVFGLELGEVKVRVLEQNLWPILKQL
jgi:hypothetical protein|tara:strand:- start:273 stop:623 length:351 start_codon:yes stop_codon:yes gene_type:complete